MAFRVFVQWGKHDWQNDFDVITNKIAEILIVPEIQRSLGNLFASVRLIEDIELGCSTYLEMGTGDGFRQLIKQRFLDLCKLGRVHHFEDVFDLVQEHNLFGTVYFWPVA